jgi:hypothetical protein
MSSKDLSQAQKRRKLRIAIGAGVVHKIKVDFDQFCIGVIPSSLFNLSLHKNSGRLRFIWTWVYHDFNQGVLIPTKYAIKSEFVDINTLRDDENCYWIGSRKCIR